MLTKSLSLCFVAVITLPRAASPQNAPDVRRIVERLDQLESENQKLLDEIHELRNELTAAQASAHGTVTPAPGSPDLPADAPVADRLTHEAPVTERLAVEESRTAELDQTKVSASQRFPLSLTGMLLFNAFANTSGNTQYPVTAGLNPGPTNSGATLRQTVLGLRFNGPSLPGGGKVSGSLFMDFFAGTNAPNNNAMRIRTGMLDLAWNSFTISVGQDKPLISPRDPTSFAQVGVSPLTAAGNLWDWNPQVRAERRFLFNDDTGLTVQGSIYETTESYSTNLPPEYAGTLERSRPAYEGRFLFFHGDRTRFEIAPGFNFGTTHVAGQSIASKIASIDWLFRPIPLLEFSGEAFNGQNVAGLGALPGFNILPSETVIPIHSHGEWGQVAVFATPKLSFHLYAGEQYNRASDLPPAGVRRNFVYAGNLMYKLAPNVIAALEASQTRTEYLGSQLRMNNHYDLALGYLF